MILANWERRKKRVNYDNIFIMFDDICDAEYEDLVKFNQIKCKGKAIITAKKYDDIENIVQIKKYEKLGRLEAYLLDVSLWTGKNPADKMFDFITWLNTGMIN